MGLGKRKKIPGIQLVKSKSSPIFGLILIFLVLISLNSKIKISEAQSIPESWQDPINLSNSGGTQNPTLLKGPSGQLHAIWEDDYASFVNRNFTDSWGQNFPLDLPFYQQKYKIIADKSGWYYVFWINEDNNLQYSGSSEANMSLTGNWLSAATIASSVVAFDVNVDDNNQINLVYTRALDTIDTPAGIYYKRTLGTISNWSDSRLIYQSKYYRSLIPPEGEITVANVSSENETHVSVNSTLIDGNISIFLGWENASLKRLFYSKSIDNGQTWQQPMEIVTPSQDLILITPRSLETVFLPETILQFWKLSEPGGNCTLNYRTSPDKGESWTTSQSLDSVFGKCPDTLHWDYLNTNTILFVAQKQNTIFLVAWDGTNWSQPQAQPELNQFINPVTFDLIEFSTISPVISNDTLYLVGKDQSASNDIFFTQKNFDDISGWYSGYSGWSPIQISDIGKGPVFGLTSVNGTKDQFNFLVTTKNFEKTNSSKLQNLTISSSGGQSLLTISDKLEGDATQITSATDSVGLRTALLWKGGKFGQIFTKWAFQDQIDNPVGWSTDAQLQTSITGQFPAVTAKDNHELFAIFSNSYNDQKGLFFVSSLNGGENWTTPILISDFSTLENCPFFDQSSIVADSSTNLFIQFQCSTYPGGTGSLGLYAIQSSDSGITWSSPVLITEQPVTWNKLLFDGIDTVHRIWKIEDTTTSLQHSFSKDQGKTWSSPYTVAIIEDSAGPTSSTIDPDGNIHILQAAHLPNGLSSAIYYRWNGTNWINGQILSLESAGYGLITSITTGIDSLNKLQAGIALTTQSNNNEESYLITANYPLTIETVLIENPQSENAIPTNSELQTSESTPEPIQNTIQATEPAPLNTQPTRSTPTFLGVIAGVGVSLGFIVVMLFIYRKKIQK